MRETNRIELKSTLTDSLEKGIVAFSISMPRNQEIMRIFKDLELVEHLGSGIPRILEFYPKECFRFTENFLRMTFPNGWDLSEGAQVEAQVEAEVEAQVEINIINALFANELSSSEMVKVFGHKDLSGNLKKALQRLLVNLIIERTIPDKPNSRLQKYRLTEKGKALQKKLNK